MKSKPTGRDPKNVNYIGLGLALGLALGAGWGTALSAALDNPAFLAIGIGCGMTLGTGIGSSLQRRHEGEQPEESGTVVKGDGDQGISEDRSS
jgi:hypothetical protein